MLLLALSPLAQAGEVGAIVRPEVAVDLASDRAHEDTIEARSRVRAFARDDLEHDARWFLEVLGEHDLLVGQSVLTASGPNKDDVEGAWDVRVGESGWQGRLGGSADLRIGNLVERWGKLDLFPVIDVVNPRDLRAGPLTPQEWQRVPIPMAQLGVGREPVRGELLLIPFSSGDRLSMNGTDWSVVRQEMIEEQLRDLVGWGDPLDTIEAQYMLLFDNLANNLDELDPSFRRGLDDAAGRQALPQALGIHGEAAARVEFTVPKLDAAVMVGALRSRQKAVTLDATMAEMFESQDLPTVPPVLGQVLEAEWPRTYVGAVEASTLIGPVALRGEGLFQSHAVVMQPWMQSATTPMVGAGLGADWSSGTRIYVVAEAAWRHLLDAPDRLVFTATDTVQVGGGVRVNLAADRLELQLGGAYHLPFSDHLIRPTVAYRVSDTVELEAGALILGGPTTPPELLRGALDYRGGFLGYFGQNDCATAAVSFIL